MSDAPERIWVFSGMYPDFSPTDYGEWEVQCPEHMPDSVEYVRADLTTPDTRDALIKELVGALAFYADKNGDGYDSEVRNYGLSLYTGAIVDDGGERARAALTRAKEAGYGAE